jgi:hypothetical protein
MNRFYENLSLGSWNGRRVSAVERREKPYGEVEKRSGICRKRLFFFGSCTYGRRYRYQSVHWRLRPIASLPCQGLPLAKGGRRRRSSSAPCPSVACRSASAPQRGPPAPRMTSRARLGESCPRGSPARGAGDAMPHAAARRGRGARARRVGVGASATAARWTQGITCHTSLREAEKAKHRKRLE